MTAIVASRDGWIVADCQETAGSEIIPSVAKKIMRVGNHTLVAAAGNAAFEVFAEEALRDAAEDVNRSVSILCRWLHEQPEKEQYYLLLVNNKHELWHLDSSGAPSEITDDFMGGGSGGLPATLWLKGYKAASNSRITASHAAQAIAVVSRSLTGISPETYTLSLYG